MASIIHDENVKMSFPRRLKHASQHFRKTKLEPALDKRMRMLEAWTADFYKSLTKGQSHTMNLIDRGISIIVPYLVMTNPSVAVNTKFPEYRSWAYTTQLALEHFLREVKFSDFTLRPAVMQSMFGLGIVKTGISRAWQVEIQGYLHDIGQPFADVVDYSNWLYDPSAKSLEDGEFAGDEYLIPTDIARDLYPKFADHIRPSQDLFGTNHPKQITGGSNVDYTLKEWTRFQDYWIPDEDIIITLLADSSYNKIISTVDWEGPEGGPYDYLAYKYPLEDVIPIPPVWGWMDMDDIINDIIRKVRKQAESQKTVLAYESAAEKDADRVAKAADRQTVRVDNIQSLKPLDFAGVNPEMYKWLQYVENQWSAQGNNLYTIGGRNAMADTLGQEQMLLSNASRSLDDMVNQVYSFTKSILEKIAWYMWTDPLIDIPVIKRVPGVIDIPSSFSSADKDGEFWDYTFDIVPYSMQRTNPDMEFQKMLMFLSQWVLPTSQLAAQQGAILDVPEATKSLAQKYNLRDIDVWYRTVTPQNAGMNPYSPDKNMGDTGVMGSLSREQNLAQQQGSSGNTSKETGNALRSAKKENMKGE